MADINPAYIGQIERGIKSPTVNTIKKIANAMGINLHTLFTPVSEFTETESDCANARWKKSCCR